MSDKQANTSFYLKWYFQLLILLLLGKNNVTVFSGMFDVEVEVVMGDVIVACVGPIKYTCQLTLYRWQPTFNWLEGNLGNLHKVTILMH